MDMYPLTPLAIMNFSTTEIVLIFLLILLLFGARKLPELAKGLGQAMREFKKATREAEDSIRSAIDDADKPAPKKAEAPAPKKVAEAPAEKPAEDEKPQDSQS